jgi:hypothetical protein
MGFQNSAELLAPRSASAILSLLVSSMKHVGGQNKSALVTPRIQFRRIRSREPERTLPANPQNQRKLDRRAL